MAITLALPPPIGEELAEESRREGISEAEHAALLICLASAFLRDESETPFRNAVKAFLAHRSLDAERVFTVFEELVRVCALAHDVGKESASFQALLSKSIADRESEFLRHWRSASVHQSVVDRPMDVSSDVASRSIPPVDRILQEGSLIGRDTSPSGNTTDPRTQVRTLLAHWRAQDNTPIDLPKESRNGESSTEALFRAWEEEDSLRTRSEQEEQQALFEEFQSSVDMERKNSKVRTLF
jgi:hypothetical protein